MRQVNNRRIYDNRHGKMSPFIKDKLRISITNDCNRHCA